MRAARYYGIKDLRVEEIPEPVCKPGWVKIKPAFVGICGTDVHEYLGGPTFAPVKPHPITGETLPITFGHEFSGTVEEIGEGVSGITVGQQVAVQPNIYDGTCSACTAGLINICYKGGFVGLSGWGGGLSDHVVVPAAYVHQLPSNVPLDIGALVEPLSVGWHAVSQAAIDEQTAVLILGGGPIGIAVIQALRARGCQTIIVSEVSAKRQRFARESGASHLVDPRHEDVVERCREITGRDGVDVVFDCAGVAVGLETACQAIRVHGLVVNVAIWEKAVPFQPNNLVFREGKYVAVLGYTKRDFEAVIKALGSGSMQPATMITKKVPLERVVEDGFHTLITDKESHVKVLIEI